MASIEQAPAAVAAPPRLAAVDMGSNAIRFLAAEVVGGRELRVLANDRRAVRLGHGVYLSGRLDGAAMDAAVQALGAFRLELDRLGIGVAQLRAVATSAVRESSNRAELLARVRRETGITIDVISGSEEARLVHLAVAARVPLGDRRWLLVDLGGGSVEVSVVDQHGILWSESHTMGSVRLLEALTETGDDPGRFRRLLQEYVSTLRIPLVATREPIAGYIATGGNIETLAKLGGDQDEIGVATLRLDTLRVLIEKLAGLSFRQRVDELGVREDRADVILPAAMVYERLAVLGGAEEILVPHVGIREGVLLDLASRLGDGRDERERREREVAASALAVGRKYLFDEAHGLQVARLALFLFDQLAPLHDLDLAARRLLHAAALLHDIGQFVSYQSHHKHSLYLLSNTELPGFSEHEMQLVGNIARYHRKSEPAAHHPFFVQLDQGEQELVRRLAAILRLADALDREHLQRVQEVRAALGRGEVTLWIEGAGDLLLEGWSLKRKAQLFSSVYGSKVRLRLSAAET